MNDPYGVLKVLQSVKEDAKLRDAKLNGFFLALFWTAIPLLPTLTCLSLLPEMNAWKL